MGLQRTPWCSGSPWWWEDPRGSVSGGPGAWRTSPSWETPRYSRNAGTCSLHPDTHTHTNAKLAVSLVFAAMRDMARWAEYLVVNVLPVEGNVDGEGWGVVMWPQRRLLVRAVTDHKVHDGLGLHTQSMQTTAVLPFNNNYKTVNCYIYTHKHGCLTEFFFVAIYRHCSENMALNPIFTLWKTKQFKGIPNDICIWREKPAFSANDNAWKMS